MSTANKKTNKTFIKTKPTFFPMGFAVGQVVGDVVIVDFIDVLNGENAVIESIALPKEKAQQLSAALIEAIENGESED